MRNIDELERNMRKRRSVITSEQIRAARSWLNMSKQELADAAKVSSATILRIERQSGRLRGMIETEERIEAALRERGIVLIENGIQGPIKDEPR